MGSVTDAEQRAVYCTAATAARGHRGPGQQSTH